MQTLEERNTYTPPNVPQVRCNCDLVLNKDSRNESKLISSLSVSGNIETTIQYDVFGEEVVRQSKKVEKTIKHTVEDIKTQYDIFGNIIKKKKIIKKTETESTDLTTQVGIDNAWN